MKDCTSTSTSTSTHTGTPISDINQNNHEQLVEQHRPITTPLIRKRSEHNSNLISSLEEIALHQEELTSIGSTLGKICGKSLKILLLQNNVISQLHTNEMKYFKVLEYLNLALNNIKVISGLHGDVNECLKKLDLTLNFIDYDRLEESLDCLATLQNLRELFMVGNPCCYYHDDGEDNNLTSCNNNNQTTQQPKWKNFKMYVISKLTRLEYLDGKQILRSERIKAMQMKSSGILDQELSSLVKHCKAVINKSNTCTNKNLQKVSDDSTTDDEELTLHCPQQRMKMSNEMASQKAEKEKNERANQPKLKNEKDFEHDQCKAIEKAREREERGDIKQCNEGKWKFQFDEDTKPGHLTLDISIQKHLSSALIDVDVHPTYISIVIKSKVLRLVLPVEVKAEKSVAQRSLTTGHLLITMPKFNPNDQAFIVNHHYDDNSCGSKRIDVKKQNVNNEKSHQCLQQELIEEAQKQLSLKGPVKIKNIVSPSTHHVDDNADRTYHNIIDKKICPGLLELESRTTCKNKEMNSCSSINDEGVSCRETLDEPPPMF